MAEDAWPGDIIGIPNHGTLRIGDTLTEGEKLNFIGVPSFAPELLQRVRPLDPMRAKHVQKALEHFAEEGASQFFNPNIGSDLIVGVVGQLQFEVLAARIRDEYSLVVRFEPAPYDAARWIEADTQVELTAFLDPNIGTCGVHHDGEPVYLARNSRALNRAQLDFPKIRFKTKNSRFVSETVAPRKIRAGTSQYQMAVSDGNSTKQTTTGRS